MNIFQKTKFKINCLKLDLGCRIENFILSRRYPDYKDDEYNCGELKFIWGIKSWDDLSDGDANMWTMNDIEIAYDRKTKEYALSIETVYQFKDSKNGEIKYLDGLLSAFTNYMNKNNYQTDKSFDFWTCQSVNLWRAKDIPALYTQFRLFVEGHKALYRGEANK